MDAALVTAFLAAAIPSFFTPGPNNLMLMTSTARFGVGRTVPHMLGVSIGFPVMVFVVGLGLGEIFTQYPWLQVVLRYAAAAYFLWMAWHLLGFKIGAVGGRERPIGFLQGMAFQWVNPKAWAMAVSLAAVFVQPDSARIPSLVLLTLGCLSLSPFSSLLWMVFGQQLEAILRRTGSERFLGAVLAGLMVVAIVLFLL